MPRLHPSCIDLSLQSEELPYKNLALNNQRGELEERDYLLLFVCYSLSHWVTRQDNCPGSLGQVLCDTCDKLLTKQNKHADTQLVLY